jgi:hypothetical protein
VHVTATGDDVAKHGLAGRHTLPDTNGRGDVPVLEVIAIPGVDEDALLGEAGDDAVDDRVDGRPVRC